MKLNVSTYLRALFQLIVVCHESKLELTINLFPYADQSRQRRRDFENEFGKFECFCLELLTVLSQKIVL
jgi:hypothetical protein